MKQSLLTRWSKRNVYILYRRSYVLPVFLMFCLSINTTLAQQQYLKATLNSSITIEPESYVHLGNVTANTILLEQIPAESDGYVSFTFSGLTPQDDIRISLENASGTTYYTMQFAGNHTALLDNSGTNFSLSNDARRNTLFKIKKCGNSIIWSDATDIPLFTTAYFYPEALFAKVTVNAATAVTLDLVFDTDTNNENCEKCAFVGGKSLFPGDIMFAGYDNASGGNRIVLKTLTPITPGTSFSLVEGSYMASNKRWYSPSNDGNIAIQKITYTGINTIAAGATICFILPTAGTGDALLANGFSINGATTMDFCVANVGATVNPQINLLDNTAAALFLVGGDWKLLDAHGEFSGRVISGLQYGGNFSPNGTSPTGGLSNLPTDIECMAIEDGLSPAIRYAYFTGSNPTIANLTNFSNWQTGSGALPSAVCGNGAPLTLESQSRHSTPPITKNTAHLYPNPFRHSFTIQLDLVEAQQVILDIYDSSGRVVKHQTFAELAVGTTTIPIPFESSASDAIYWTRIQLAKEIIVKRLVRQGTGLN